jgi:hypothetical protein
MKNRGTSIVAQMRKVEALNEKEQALGAQITALQASQRECAGSYQEQLGELVTKMAIAAGVHRLPLAFIDAAFKHIADCGSDATIASEWIAKYSGAAIVKAVRDSDGGARMSKAEGGMLVTVKLSANASDKKKIALREAGLKWNGRRRSWIGTADAEAHARLRELFGDRVQTQTQLKPSTGRDRSPAAETAQQDAAVGDVTTTTTTTTDAPMPDHAGPAKPAGASGPASAPTTPPVNQADTAVMRAGGAVVVGAEAAEADAGDAPVAPAPVPPPVVAKSPAPPARFPNFPCAGARG